MIQVILVLKYQITHFGKSDIKQKKYLTKPSYF